MGFPVLNISVFLSRQSGSDPEEINLNESDMIPNYPVKLDANLLRNGRDRIL